MENESTPQKQFTKVHIMDIDDNPPGDELREIFGKEIDDIELLRPSVVKLISSIAQIDCSPQSPAENLLRLLLLIKYAPEETSGLLMEVVITHTLLQTRWLAELIGNAAYGDSPDDLFILRELHGAGGDESQADS